MSGRTYLGRTGQKRQDPRPVQPCYVCPVRRHKLFWRFALSGGWMCWASVTAQIARHGPGTPTERITAAPMTKGQHEPATNKRPVPQKKKKKNKRPVPTPCLSPDARAPPSACLNVCSACADHRPSVVGASRLPNQIHDGRICAGFAYAGV